MDASYRNGVFAADAGACVPEVDDVATRGGIILSRNDPPAPAVIDSENGVMEHCCPAKGSNTCLNACAGGISVGAGGITDPAVGGASVVESG